MAREHISILAASDVKLKDSVNLWFGEGANPDDGTLGDVKLRWDGTNLDMLPTVDDSQFYLGDGTYSLDLRFYGNSATQYVSWDASANRFKFEDSITLEFGTGAGAGQGNAGDASINFDGTRLVISPIAAGGIVHIGDAADTTGNEVHVFDGGSGGKAGKIVLYDSAGTTWYYWPDTSGNLYVKTSAPSNDTDGAKVGGQ